jgi:hypothetical protein
MKKDNKSAVINVRCTPEQKAKIKKIAKESEVSVSKLLMFGYEF